MNSELAPIFKLRELCLAEVNPVFYKRNADLIHRASLAAQDYVLSGASREYNAYVNDSFMSLPGYIAVHTKYNLVDKVNPNLVMDLTWSFKTDLLGGIIDPQGNIKNKATLYRSRMLGVYHNSDLSGTPNSIFQLYPERVERLIQQATQKTK